MKKRTMPAIQLVLKPSYSILACYSLISIGCCIAVYLIPLPIIAKIALVLLCLLYTVYIIQRDVLMRYPWSWVKIEVTSEGVLRLYNKQLELFEPSLANSTYINPYLTVLNFKPLDVNWHVNHSVIITPWHVIDESRYRQLRVWLKWWS